jgi:hypothetical protein
MSWRLTGSDQNLDEYALGIKVSRREGLALVVKSPGANGYFEQEAGQLGGMQPNR